MHYPAQARERLVPAPGLFQHPARLAEDTGGRESGSERTSMKFHVFNDLALQMTLGCKYLRIAATPAGDAGGPAR